jgi:two-component system catabolic regulation response regulator CreB
VRAELKTAASSSSPESGPFLVDEERFEIRYNGTRLDLSVYEFKILKVFLRSPGRVFTREHLMALCWEDPDMSLERTVDAHIKNIRQKLRSIGVAQEAIVTHRGLGYSFLENFS